MENANPEAAAWRDALDAFEAATRELCTAGRDVYAASGLIEERRRAVDRIAALTRDFPALASADTLRRLQAGARTGCEAIRKWGVERAVLRAETERLLYLRAIERAILSNRDRVQPCVRVNYTG